MADSAQPSPVDRIARVAGCICAVLLLVALLASFQRTGHDLEFSGPLGDMMRTMVLRARLFLGLAFPFMLVGSLQRRWKSRFFFFGAAVLFRYFFTLAEMRLDFGPGFWMSQIDGATRLFMVGRGATFYGSIAVAAMALGFFARNRSIVWRFTGQVGVAGCAIGVVALGLLFFQMGGFLNASPALLYLWIGLMLVIYLAVRALKETGPSNRWAERALTAALAIALLQDLAFSWIRPPIVGSVLAFQWMLENISIHLIDWLALVGFLEINAPTQWPPPEAGLHETHVDPVRRQGT